MSTRYMQMAGLLVGAALTMSALAQDSGEGTVISIETRYPGVYVADAEGMTLYTLSGVAAAGEGGLETFDTQTGGAGSTETGGADGTQTGGAGGEGSAVYSGTEAEGEVLPCTAECLEAWPPLTVEGEATIGEGVLTQDLLGTTEREDGGTQVTYNGYPLYYFSGDEEPGDFNGLGVQGFGGEWYMVSSEGGLLAASEGTGGAEGGN
jgi:predicted lipoprotein with Yx(FWY)xxD motif